MNDFTDERIAECKARCEAATFGGGASLPFWQAVWGFYDMLDGQLPMPEQRRDDILYDYGCKAQEMESEYKHALDALAEARRERNEAEALLLALHKAHHLDQGLEWKVDNLLHERGLLENGNDAR